MAGTGRSSVPQTILWVRHKDSYEFDQFVFRSWRS